MPEAPLQSVETQSRPAWLRDSLLILLLVAATVAFRATSFVPAVVDTDEGLFMVQAREWLRGGWPLVAAWDMHPVGAPALYALSFLAFGVSVEAVRALGLACVLATGAGLYAIARNLGAPRSVGAAAWLIYAAHSVLLSGLCTTTEILMAPFITWAMALAVGEAMRALGSAPQGPRVAPLVGAGLLVGSALVVKQVVVPAGCLIFALMVGPALLRRAMGFRRLAGFAAAYALLCATPFILFGVAYWVQGWLMEYVDGSLLAPFRYSLERVAPGEAWRRLAAAAFTLGLPVAVALVALATWRPGRALTPLGLATAFAALWFAAETLAIVGPGFYFSHYFLLWLPPLSLLAAVGLWWLSRNEMLPGRAAASMALLVGLVAGNAWFSELAIRFDRGPGLFHPDPPRQVAAAVAEVAGPDGLAFMANYHPATYVLSNTRAPTRFVFPPHLTGEFEDLSTTSTATELGRVLAQRPAAIVVDRQWMRNMRAAAAQQVDAALAAEYELFTTVMGPESRVEVWALRGREQRVRPAQQPVGG
jgi:hypothetical protein